MDKNILIIHPYDKTTTFLDRIKNHLQTEFQDNLHYFSVKTNEESHMECLDAIRRFSENGLILFMGHGRSNCLFGAIADEGEAMVSNEARLESPDRYYKNENFISFDNIHEFTGKKIVCLTCNSNAQIGREAVSKGAKVLLGFGDLPTSIEELKELGENGKKGMSLERIEQALKTEINYIIKTSIRIGILKGHTFRQLVNLINIITNQRITFYLVDQKKVKERKQIANYLYTFKREIKIHGNVDENLVV